MTTAEELFTHTFWGSNNRFATIYAFRRVAELGLPAATTMVQQEWFDFAHALFHDSQYDRFFNDKNLAMEATGGVEGMGALLAADQLKKHRTSVDAASLVFAHSILDSAAFDYCRVTAMHSPPDWMHFIENRKIAIIDMKERSYSELVQEKLEELLESLDRESLLSKIDRLFQICRPGSDFRPLRDYFYDRGRIESIDKLRHDIVHGSGPDVPLSICDQDIFFIQQTANYLMALVNMRFDIRMNPQHVA